MDGAGRGIWVDDCSGPGLLPGWRDPRSAATFPVRRCSRCGRPGGGWLDCTPASSGSAPAQPGLLTAADRATRLALATLLSLVLLNSPKDRVDSASVRARGARAPAFCPRQRAHYNPAPAKSTAAAGRCRRRGVEPGPAEGRAVCHQRGVPYQRCLPLHPSHWQVSAHLDPCGQEGTPYKERGGTELFRVSLHASMELELSRWVLTQEEVPAPRTLRAAAACQPWVLGVAAGECLPKLVHDPTKNTGSLSISAATTAVASCGTASSLAPPATARLATCTC